jgi:hypothetical protein
MAIIISTCVTLIMIWHIINMFMDATISQLICVEIKHHNTIHYCICKTGSLKYNNRCKWPWVKSIQSKSGQRTSDSI